MTVHKSAPAGVETQFHYFTFGVPLISLSPRRPHCLMYLDMGLIAGLEGSRRFSVKDLWQSLFEVVALIGAVEREVGVNAR